VVTMSPLAETARRTPLTTFFALAFALTWALLPLARASIAVSLLALFGPAAAAVITTVLMGGRDWHDLRDRCRA
jgi:ABC-type bacteriocin/lantibiotic exporter with double-glycine peptidase domain